MGRNKVGSVVGGGGHYLCFRRKLFNTIVGCGFSRQRLVEERSDCSADDSSCSNSNSSSSRKLSEILKHSQTEGEVVVEEESSSSSSNSSSSSRVERKVEVFEELQGVVKRLQTSEDEEAMVGAAMDIRRLAKDDSDARETLAMLGAIPPLVRMLDSSSTTTSASLYALLNLAIRNDQNKASIVKAGGVHKMLNLTTTKANSDVIVANLLGLSALDANKPIIASASGALPFLVKTLVSSPPPHSQPKLDSLRAIFNLSIYPPNISLLLQQTELLHFLLAALVVLDQDQDDIPQKSLSILINLVSTPQGRKAITNFPHALPTFIHVLNWNDSPSCQEKACYILMIIAHKGGYSDRQAMSQAGIVSVLLELTLIGTTLAQNRASRILECLLVVDHKGKQQQQQQATNPDDNSYQGGGAVSAPICAYSSLSATTPNQQEDEMSNERKAVNQLVQQSLHNNMRRIVKRANLPQHFVPSDHFNSLTGAPSTSKSLPF